MSAEQGQGWLKGVTGGVVRGRAGCFQGAILRGPSSLVLHPAFACSARSEEMHHVRTRTAVWQTKVRNGVDCGRRGEIEQLDRLETHNGWMHGSGFRRAISGSIRKVAAVRAAGIGAHGVGVKVGDTGAGSHRGVCGRGRVFREGICWIGRRRNKCPSGLDRCCQSAARVESISERGFRRRIRVNPGGIPQNSGGKLCAGALEVG